MVYFNLGFFTTKNLNQWIKMNWQLNIYEDEMISGTYKLLKIANIKLISGIHLI